jgi:hypothetical protein
VFAEEAAKSKWKGLRDNFRKEIKKAHKPKSGEGAPPHTSRWIHLKSLEFLRDVMEPGKTSGNIAFPTICKPEQPDSEATEINVEENEVRSACSEDATSETHPSPTCEAPKRKRGRSNFSYQEKMVQIEEKKLEWLSKQEDDQNDDDLHFLRSLLPYMKQIPPNRKLFFRSQIQNMMADEINAPQNK